MRCKAWAGAGAMFGVWPSDWPAFRLFRSRGPSLSRPPPPRPPPRLPPPVLFRPSPPPPRPSPPRCPPRRPSPSPSPSPPSPAKTRRRYSERVARGRPTAAVPSPQGPRLRQSRPTRQTRALPSRRANARIIWFHVPGTYRTYNAPSVRVAVAACERAHHLDSRIHVPVPGT